MTRVIRLCASRGVTPKRLCGWCTSTLRCVCVCVSVCVCERESRQHDSKAAMWLVHQHFEVCVCVWGCVGV